MQPDAFYEKINALTTAYVYFHGSEHVILTVANITFQNYTFTYNDKIYSIHAVETVSGSAVTWV